MWTGRDAAEWLIITFKNKPKCTGAEATRAPDFWAGVGEDLQALQQQSPQHGLLTAIPRLPWAQALLYAALQGTFPPPSPGPTRAMLAGAMGGLQLPAPALEEVVLQLVADWVVGAESGQDAGVQRGMALLAAVPFSSARLAGEARLLEAAQVGVWGCGGVFGSSDRLGYEDEIRMDGPRRAPLSSIQLNPPTPLNGDQPTLPHSLHSSPPGS